MAEETLLPNADDSGWPSGTYDDVNNTIATPSGTPMSATTDPDVLILDVGDSAVVDGDTVTNITIDLRARVTGVGGKDDLIVDLLIGGVAQGSAVTHISVGATYSTLSANGLSWNVDRSETDMDGLQIQITTAQRGMGVAATYEVDEVEVIVTYTAGATAPVLTLPTEADITQSSATVGCTTDTAAGTLYWFISTSASAPTATNLKAGTGSATGVEDETYGSVATPGTGIETFSASALTYNTAYYTYFIHTNTIDSNILESGIWNTLDADADSETFGITTNKTFSQQSDIPKVMSFDTTNADSSTNLKDAIATISYNAQLNQILSQYKLTSESISLLTNLDYSASVSFAAAIQFIITLAEQESNNKDAVASVNLQGTLDFIFSNVLTGAKSITLGTLLDKVLTQNKIASETQTLATDLDFSFVSGKSVAGTSTFGVTAAYAVNNFKAILAQMNAGIVLTKASQVDRIVDEAVSFSYTLSFSEELQAVGILDDPIYSAGNYIFVDLANVLASGTGVVAGSITFTTSLGQQQTVGLIGEAAVALLTTLAMQGTATKLTSEAETFAIQMDQNLDFARLLTFTAGLDLDILPVASTNALKSILYSISADISESTVKQSDKVLTFATELNAELLKQLTSNLSISLDTSLDHVLAVQADLNEAITYLTSLNLTFLSGEDEAIIFAIDALQTSQVQQILNPTLTLLANLTQVEQKALITSETIAFLIQLQQQQAGVVGIFGAITFAAELNQVELKTLTVDKAFELIINLADSTGIQLDKTETILLLIQLADTYDNTKSVPGSILFNTNLDQVSTNLLDKLASIVLISSLNHVQDKTLSVDRALNLAVNLALEEGITLVKDEVISLSTILDHNYINIKDVAETLSLNINLNHLPTNLLTKLASVIFNNSLNQQVSVQVDFNTAVTFANILTTSFLGNTTGAIEAGITFALNITKDSVGISTLFDSISFSNLLDLTGIAGRNLLDSITMSAQLGDLPTVNLTREGTVNFQTFYNKIDTTNLDYRPSIDFDLQAIDGSIVNKNTLASLLIEMEADLITDANRTLPVLINYGLTQNLETELNLIAEGTITMTTAMAESSTLQMLGQAGITFGHLLGLSALSSADFSESIAFGTITDFSVSGFVIQFTVNTPDGRILKIYFEDRITIVDEENRILKVYKTPDTTIN